MKKRMLARCLEDVADEFEFEDYTAMFRLIQRLQKLPWPEGVAFDTSKLRLLIGSPNAERAMVVVACANTRKYGIPMNPNFESFDITTDIANTSVCLNDLTLNEATTFIADVVECASFRKAVHAGHVPAPASPAHGCETPTVVSKRRPYEDTSASLHR